MTILDKIIAYKKDEVAEAKRQTPATALSALAKTYKPRGFKTALERRASVSPALIAEIKKASPSKGLIREDFDPAAHARAYEAGGATCLSVLTDAPSFQGHKDHLRAARAACALPILRKDFMIDPYQIIEARAWGADCILLIMACLNDSVASELSAAAREFDLDILVEVHDRNEMEKAANLGATLIGVNNRNLKTFHTDLRTTATLAACAPEGALLVAESGISTNADINALTGYGAKAFLVGEALMRQADLTSAAKALLTPRMHTA